MNKALCCYYCFFIPIASPLITHACFAGLFTCLLKRFPFFRKLNHPNVLKLISSYEQPYPCVVTEWMSNGDLYHYLEGRDSLPEQTILSLASGIAKGLEYLHSQNIIHRDLKSPNILVSSSSALLLRHRFLLQRV